MIRSSSARTATVRVGDRSQSERARARQHLEVNGDVPARAHADRDGRDDPGSSEGGRFGRPAHMGDQGVETVLVVQVPTEAAERRQGPEQPEPR
jgi:hypothetical protein